MQNGFVIKAKSAIKKVAAISAGALMAGSTMMGAVAAATPFSLADYPAPFITNGKWVGLIVVGADAKAGDIIGATDIAATLAQGAAVSAGTGTSTVSGGKREEVALDTALNATATFGNTLDDDDLAGLQDTTVNIDIGSTEDDYDVHDELRLGGSRIGTPLFLETGLTASNPDADYKTDAFLDITGTRPALGYFYVFDESLSTGNFIANATDADPITLSFLGKNLEITASDATSITAQVGEEVFMNVDDSVTIEGHTVKLLNVASGTSPTTIVVDVDGVQETVSGTEKVSGIRVKVKETFYSDARAERSATLIVGTDATKKYTDGDEYIGQDEDDPDWVWDLASLNTASPVIGVVYDQIKDDPSDMPTKVGESLELPNGYIGIQLESFKENDYKRYTLDTSTEELRNNAGTTVLDSSASVLHFHAEGASHNGFKIGSDESDDVYFYANQSAGGGMQVFFKDSDDGNKLKRDSATTNINGTSTDTTVDIDFQDTSLQVKAETGATIAEGNLTIVLTGDDLKINWEVSGTSDITYLGETDQDDTTTDDLMYGTRNIASFEEDTRTSGGIIVKDPDASTPGDSFDFDINGDESDFTVWVNVVGPGSTVTAAKGGAVVVQPVSGVPVAKLDTEVTDKTAFHMLLLGGPAVNRLSAEAWGLPYPTFSAAVVPTDAAIIKLVNNAFGGTKVALIVAGWEEANTRAASSVLKDYSAYASKLTGTEVKVSGTGTAVTVGPVTVA